MATEKREAQARESKTLARRAANNLTTAFDESAGTMRRVRAGSTLAAGVGLPIVGSVVGAEVVARVDPNLIHALGPLGPTAWITATAAGGTALLASGIGGISVGMQDGYYRRETRLHYRSNMRSMFAHTRTTCLWVAGAAGIVATGFAAGDLTVGAHLGAAAQVFGDVAVAGGVTAAIAGVGRRSWAVGLPAPDRSLS